VCSGSSASFTVSTIGDVSSYQWRKDGLNLSDGGNINGAATATLSINPAVAADAASYDCVVSGSCSAPVTSTAATLTIDGYSLAPMGQSFPSAGGFGNVTVTTTASCSWTGVSNDSWITITNGSLGTGSGTVDYTVAINSGAGRTGTMTIAGQTFTVTQSSPTLITLKSLAAAAYDNGVLIEWETGVEVDNLGFNVYREEGGRRELINSQLIAGSALATSSTLLTGNSYSWWDKTPITGGASYWLEDVDLNLKSAWHGPVYAKRTGGAPPARSQANLLSEIAKHAAAASSRSAERAISPLTMELAASQIGLADRAAVKIGVRHEGWYRVTQPELVSAGLNPNVDPRFLRLFAEGSERPIIVSTHNGLFDESASIEFYGIGLDTPATDKRVYWLIADQIEGLRIKQVKGDGIHSTDTSFPFTAERKDRTIYFSALRNGDKENFFGAVIAQDPVDQTITLPHVDAAANESARLEVTLQGVTMLPHLVRVQLNGVDISQIPFNNQSQGIMELDVAHSLLREGPNVVTLLAQGGPGDVSLVDYLRLTYQHSFKADDNALRFTATGNRQVRVEGFSGGGIRAMDITIPDEPEEIYGQVEQETTGFAITIASPEMGDRQLIAISDSQLKHPASIVANIPSSWRQPKQAADLVMIAPRDFSASLDALKTARQKQNLKVVFVDVEDIYDEFSYGEKTPQAVKDFLSYAKNNWKPAPRFVLIAGDASADPRDYLGAGDFDLVPTKLVDTDFMETASDDWFADFDGDGLAEMAFGRLPIRTSEEAASIVSKILSYDSSTPSEEALLVADTNDGYDFEGATRQLRDLLPSTLRIEEIDRGRLDPATAKTRVREAIIRGQSVVNYAGHGSLNQWRGDLLTTEDAYSLSNSQRPTLFVMMTCLNGYFDDPVSDGLAEALIKVEKGGAVAVWASSGLTLPTGQSVMNQELYRLLFAPSRPGPQSMTLGEAVLRAKASVSDQDIRRTWILFGDPTMRLR
jgi:hypothetical protein